MSQLAPVIRKETLILCFNCLDIVFIEQTA